MIHTQVKYLTKLISPSFLHKPQEKTQIKVISAKLFNKCVSLWYKKNEDIIRICYFVQFCWFSCNLQGKISYKIISISSSMEDAGDLMKVTSNIDMIYCHHLKNVKRHPRTAVQPSTTFCFYMISCEMWHHIIDIP